MFHKVVDENRLFLHANLGVYLAKSFFQVLREIQL